MYILRFLSIIPKKLFLGLKVKLIIGFFFVLSYNLNKSVCDLNLNFILCLGKSKFIVSFIE